MKRRPVDYRSIDRRIWEEELADFLPMRLFDAHAHYLRNGEISTGHPEEGLRSEETLENHLRWAECLYRVLMKTPTTGGWPRKPPKIPGPGRRCSSPRI